MKQIDEKTLKEIANDELPYTKSAYNVLPDCECCELKEKLYAQCLKVLRYEEMLDEVMVLLTLDGKYYKTADKIDELLADNATSEEEV